MAVQIVVPNRGGRFTLCPKCGYHPRHIAHAGPLQGEPVAFKRYPIRHRLECSCGFATPWQACLRQCIEVWGEKFTQRPLRIPKPDPLPVAA